MNIPRTPITDPSLKKKVRSGRQKPKLIWPSARKNMHGKYTAYDASSCPSLIEVGRQLNCEYECLEFWAQVSQTKELFIMDKYFDVRAMRRLLSAVKDRKNGALEKVHLLCSSSHSTRDDFSKLRDRIRSEYRHVKGVFRFKGNQEPGKFFDIHDRFAITDDELWHFGSTVGGVSGDLTALSRGWMDQAEAFKKMFGDAFRRAR